MKEINNAVDLQNYYSFLNTWIDIVKFKTKLHRKLKDSDWTRLNPFIKDIISNVQSEYKHTDINIGLKHSIDPNGILTVADKLKVDSVELKLALEVMCNTKDATYDEPNHCYHIN